jgi:diguanylate cyclase (GGDEF) domain
MNKFFIKFFPVISSVFILFLHISGYITALYLPDYSMLLIWLSSGCIDIIFILKLGKITRSFHKSMYIDTLTQLNNRDFFYESISDAMKKLQKKQSYVSLLIIDLDNFKNINDTYGHIADRIRSTIDSHDFFYNNILFKVTVSIGITSVGNKMDINAFVDLADKALYKAKTNKNSVAFLDACVDL